MKIKILLAPALIVMMITMIIWLIYPAYTNGVDGVKERSAELTKQREAMDKLDSNISNVGKLGAYLDANFLDSALVYSYIPQSKEEEKIIENLNSLATGSTLSVLNISVSEIKDADVPVEVNTISIAPSGSESGTEVQTPAAPKVAPKNLKVVLSVVGGYDNLKGLLGRVRGLKRFSQFSLLTIKTLLKEDQSVSDSLQMDLVLNFNYLNEPKRVADGDLGNEIFSKESFDRQPIEAIKNSRSINVNNVSPGQRRGNNPFFIAK